MANKLLDKIEAKELHKTAIKNFVRRPVEVEGIDDTWCADLVDMSAMSKQNKGYKWILTVIDVLSRHAWAVPLKDKKGPTVLDAMSMIISKSNRSPKKLWIDQGSEFLNKEFKKNFDQVYHTFGEFHAAPIERFNRTLKDRMWYKFTKNDSEEWVSRLPKLLAKYNNTIHSSIKMTPIEGSKKKNEQRLLDLQTEKVMKVKTAKPKLYLDDLVRLSLVKNVFEKGYKPRWSFKLYKVVGINKTRPPTYMVFDLEAHEPVQGTFYEQELQRSQVKWSKEKGYYV